MCVGSPTVGEAFSNARLAEGCCSFSSKTRLNLSIERCHDAVLNCVWLFESEFIRIPCPSSPRNRRSMFTRLSHFQFDWWIVQKRAVHFAIAIAIVLVLGSAAACTSGNSAIH